jgi:hypothetical protein
MPSRYISGRGQIGSTWFHQRRFINVELFMSMLIMVGEEEAFQNLTIAELLHARIQGRTAGRLRYLRIHEIGDQVCVCAAAPSYYVRQLAEQAALSVVARDHLQLEIDVLSTINCGEPGFEQRTDRKTDSANSFRAVRR